MSTPIPFDNAYDTLPDALYAPMQARAVKAPKAIAINDALARDLGIDVDWLHSPAGVAAMAGSAFPEGASGLALAYAGHQFGNFAPVLGDGRAVLLGEVVNNRGQRVDIHLKGTGRTPYSRGGDGKAALGPVLREYILCEAMAALGVPTTRALAVALTGETVVREAPMPGGVFARVASSHIRIGTFQYLYAREDFDTMRALADFAIARHEPAARDADNPYAALLESVVRKQAALVAQWLCLGFIHGVMNTDNMTISGETIDYGPCAFMDGYNPAQVYSSIDHMGRYAYGKQPSIAQWNLANLAQALLPILHEDNDQAIGLAQRALDAFPETFQTAYINGLRAKLGLLHEDDGDFAMAQDLLKTMAVDNVDFTLAFRRLSDLNATDDAAEDAFMSLFADPLRAMMWLTSWRSRLALETRSDAERQAAMRQVNPIYIPRNHRVEAAIQAALVGDFTVFAKLNTLLADPFTERAEAAGFELGPEPGEEVLQTFCGT
ncbi:MAG: YdiU family protein [Ahrensia sp.]